MADDPRAGIVNALLEAFVDGWNRHDAKGLAQMFAVDGELYNLRAKRVASRDAIEKFFTRSFSAALATSQLTSPEVRIRFVGQDAAAVDLLATLQGAKDPKGQPRDDRRILFDGTAGPNGQGGWCLAIAHLRPVPPEGEGKAADAPSDGA